MSRLLIILAICSTLSQSQGVEERRINPQDASNPGSQVIDNIFNIPITALRQTAAVAQNANPGSTKAIDDVFKIPISTLEAVGDLVKSTSAQRRLNSDEIQQLKKERRERVLAQRERQRLQREQLQNQRLQQKQLKKLIKRYHKDPFGVNSLTDLLVGHHGLLGGHGQHGLNNILGGQNGHNFQGGNQGIFSAIHNHGNSDSNRPNRPNRPSHSYEVYENIEEDGGFAWQSISSGIGSFTGSRPSAPPKIQNKIAPKDGRPSKSKYSVEDVKIQNKVAPASHRRSSSIFPDDPPLEDRVATNNGRVVFH